MARMRMVAIALVVIGFVFAYTPAKADPTWNPVANMSVPRSFETATLLQNGKVLVAGGFASNGVLATAEIYDPASNSWSAAGELAQGRGEHTATLLQNGKVLVAGGSTNFMTPLSSAELYDPVANTWSAAGTPLAPMLGHTATLLQNGQVLVAGGTPDGSSVFGTCQLYNPSTNTWAAAANLELPRAQHADTLLNNGMVLVSGGGTANGMAAMAELYNPATNVWTPGGEMIQPRTLHTATLLSNGMVLVAGGQDQNSNLVANAELYNPTTNSWGSGGTLANPRIYNTATPLLDSQVMVAGGVGNSQTTLSSCELYSPLSNTWSSTANLPNAILFHAAALLPDGKVLTAGGTDLSGDQNLAQVYDPTAVSAGQTPPRLINLSFRGSVGTGGNILIAGFVVGGSGAKNLLIRGDGPSLASFGVSGALANPQLTLFDSMGHSLYSNSGWGGSSVLSQAFTQVGAFSFEANSTDSALLESLNPAAYTAQLAGVNNSTGVGLIEVYDADTDFPSARLVNISARGNVGTGSGIIITGFVIAGSVPETVVIRGVGPTLSTFGVQGSLASTQLALYDSGNNVVASNSGWGGGALLSGAFADVGAFSLPSASADSALVVTLAPGAYTAQLSGSSGATGVGLVEVYEMQ